MTRFLSVAFLLLSASAARADTITLDSGATIQGDLARFEFGGDCQISVTEGDLSGVIVIVPCHRVASFVRTSPRVPVAVSTQEPAAVAATAPPPADAVLPAQSPVASAATPAAASAPLLEPLGGVPAALSQPVVSSEAVSATEPVTEPDAAVPVGFEALLSANPFDDEPDEVVPGAASGSAVVPGPAAANQPRPAPSMDAPPSEPAPSSIPRTVKF